MKIGYDCEDERGGKLYVCRGCIGVLLVYLYDEYSWDVISRKYVYSCVNKKKVCKDG